MDTTEPGWTIDIDATGDAAALTAAEFDTRLEAFTAALDAYSGAVASDVERTRYGARFSLDTDVINPVEVLELGLDVFHDAAERAGMPPWQIVRCEILTYAEDDGEEEDDDG